VGYGLSNMVFSKQDRKESKERAGRIIIAIVDAMETVISKAGTREVDLMFYYVVVASHEAF
jgi:hypothetical protein